MFISVTRLKVKNLAKMPSFFKHASGSMKQAGKAKRLLHKDSYAELLKLTFWTLSAWESEQDMRNYLRKGAHREAMKKAGDIAIELDSINFTSETIPTWKEARQMLLADPDSSKTVFYVKSKA